MHRSMGGTKAAHTFQWDIESFYVSLDLKLDFFNETFTSSAVVIFEIETR